MKRCLPFAFALLLLSSCATKGTHVWWNPLTWGKNRAVTVEKIDAKQEANSQQVNHEAQREAFKTVEVLKFAPQDNRAVQLATRTASNAYSLLSISNGPLDLGAQQQDRETVTQLLSENIQLRDKGEKAQQAAEGTQAKLSAENKQLQADKDEAVAKLAASYQEERKLANTVRNFWWVIGVIVFLVVGGTILNVAARFIPALSGVARVVSGVMAPALAYTEARATAGLQKLGHAISAARAEIPEATEKVVEYIDEKLDTDNKKVVAAAANVAPRT